LCDYCQPARAADRTHAQRRGSSRVAARWRRSWGWQRQLAAEAPASGLGGLLITMRVVAMAQQQQDAGCCCRGRRCCGCGCSWANPACEGGDSEGPSPDGSNRCGPVCPVVTQAVWAGAGTQGGAPRTVPVAQAAGEAGAAAAAAAPRQQPAAAIQDRRPAPRRGRFTEEGV
jgi:hypothetical protein